MKTKEYKEKSIIAFGLQLLNDGERVIFAQWVNDKVNSGSKYLPTRYENLVIELEKIAQTDEEQNQILTLIGDFKFGVLRKLLKQTTRR